MHQTLFSLPFAGIVGLGASELLVIALVLVMMIVLPITVVAIALFFKHRQQHLWHETARLALEKGQPLPAPAAGSFPAPGDARTGRNDVRTGLILIAVGIGIAVFFRSVGSRDASGIGAIPGFIGIALLLFGLFSRQKSPTDNHPPRT